MLSGKLWPAHPKPLPDEILSSWIVRVAEANAIKLQTLCWMLFGNERSPWNRDIDRSAPKWLLKAICEHTGTSYWDAYHTTLTTYRTILYPGRQRSGQLRWILPIRTHGMTREGFGQQFCPQCLAEDEVPYFRKSWRVALFTFCPCHSVVLRDACPACGQPVMFYRRDFGKELLSAGLICECYACGFDFRQTEPMSPVFVTLEVERSFRAMLESLFAPHKRTGSFDLGFFQVLHQLTRIMAMRQNAGRLFKYATACIGCESLAIPRDATPIEQRSSYERHRFLELGLWFLADLAPRLTAAWRAKAVRYNLLTKDFSEVPAWYGHIVEMLTDWRGHGY